MSRIAETGFVYSVPDALSGKVKFSKVYINHGVMEKETTFGIDLTLPEMRLAKTVTTADIDLLPGKIEAALHAWAEQYERYDESQKRARKAASVEDMSRAAQSELDNLRHVLDHTLDVHDAVDWDAIKIRGEFRARPETLFADGAKPDFIEFDDFGRPTAFVPVGSAEKPTLQAVKMEYGLVARLARENAIRADYERRLEQWIEKDRHVAEENRRREQVLHQATARFEQMQRDFEMEKQRNNEALENIRARYALADPGAVEEYCDLVLNRSRYADYFAKNWSLEYQPGTRSLVVDYELPGMDRLPVVRAYTYDEQRDRTAEVPISDAERRQLFESVCYQVCVRTIHELLEADVADAIDSVTFNGVIRTVNPATGRGDAKVIISVSAPKSEFITFDLSQVDPRATVRHLGGVAGEQLADLVAVTPQRTLQRTARRVLK
jgi:restriction system protein